MVEQPEPKLSPGMLNARARSRAVDPGRLVAVPFTGADVADFIGLFGASFIAKVAGSLRPSVDVRWFHQGDPSPTSFAPQVIRRPGEYSPEFRSWLIDVSVATDIFTDPPKSRAAATVRFSQIDEGRSWAQASGGLAYPGSPRPEDFMSFSFLPWSNDTSVIPGQELPLACWIQMPPPAGFTGGRDLLADAKSAQRACLFVVKFD